LAAVDEGLRVYFNPRLVAELMGQRAPAETLAELGWVWVHEISHVLRDHADRARQLHAQPQRWNLAADCEINDGPAWADLRPPRRFPPVLPDHFGLPQGQLAEFYYGSDPIEAATQSEWLATSSASGDEEAADEGSGVHGQVRSWELEVTDTRDPAVSPLEQKVLRRQLAKAIEQIKYRGEVPGGWIRWAGDVLHPRVDWRQVLRRRVKGAIVESIAARADYHYGRPHRRGEAYAPFLRPTPCAEHQPRVACVVDTSGSMSSAELTRAFGEVAGVLDALRTPVTLIPCDAVAYDAVRVLKKSDLRSLAQGIAGGGGTDMVAGIQAALTLKPPPDAVIVLTDGMTPYPAECYRTPVVFGILDLGMGLAYKPPSPPWHDRDVILIDQSG
jgi:predicted metal-dependent peptidase